MNLPRLPRRFAGAIALAASAVAMFALPGIASADEACAPSGAGKLECTYRIGTNSSDIEQPMKVSGYEVRQGLTLGIPKPDVDGYVTAMETDIVDADGDPVPISRLMLHHIVYFNLSQHDETCNSYMNWDGSALPFSAERFYAAGEERAKMLLPPGYGYPLGADDHWGMTYMVMNHRQLPDQAYIQYKMTVVKGPQAASVTPVKPYWMDEENCKADPIYNVAGDGGKGSKEDRKWDYTMPESGRLVAGGGHVHGGAYRLSLQEPNCDNRKLVNSKPTWGLPSHPFYNVKPVLHEPGPINMSGMTTESGIPVNAGEKLTLNSVYDDSRPHVRVMGIMITYFAPDPAVTQDCGAIPDDVVIHKTDEPGRSEPPRYRIPIYAINEDGEARRVKAPAGDLIKEPSGTTVDVDARSFDKPNIKVKAGSKVNWQFNDSEIHNVTLANGPLGIGSPNLDAGRSFSKTLRKPGTYRFFCALHPVQMIERVEVVKKGKRGGK